MFRKILFTASILAVCTQGIYANITPFIPSPVSATGELIGSRTFNTNPSWVPVNVSWNISPSGADWQYQYNFQTNQAGTTFMFPFLQIVDADIVTLPITPTSADIPQANALSPAFPPNLSVESGIAWSVSRALDSQGLLSVSFITTIAPVYGDFTMNFVAASQFYSSTNPCWGVAAGTADSCNGNTTNDFSFWAAVPGQLQTQVPEPATYVTLASLLLMSLAAGRRFTVHKA